MKRTLKTALLAFSMLLAGTFLNNLSAQYDYNYGNNNNYGNNYGSYYGNNEVTYQTFYDQLSPYGRWVEYPEYGYVWVPDAGDDFRPYSSNGHWVFTEDYEWMWVSDYDWGWAPFHYGQWEQDPYYGWFWVPGYEWSPAWVAWRDGGDYYGWAPIRPGFNININIGSYNPPNNYWSFVPRRYITSPRVYDYYVDRSRNITIINYTTVININRDSYDRYGFRSGPSRYEVERYCGRINPVRFRDSYNPGRTFYRNNEVSFYRPQVRREVNRTETPRQFERYDRSGSFRDRTVNNNGRTDVSDTRRNSDNGFRRNNDVVPNRTDNNVPIRTDNGGFRRNNDNVPVRPDNAPVRTEDGGFRRPERKFDNNGGQQPDPRVVQPEIRNEQVRNNDGRNNTNNGEIKRDERRFERRSDINTSQQRPAPVQRTEPVNNNFRPAEQSRSFERRAVEQPRERTEAGKVRDFKSRE